MNRLMMFTLTILLCSSLLSGQALAGVCLRSEPDLTKCEETPPGLNPGLWKMGCEKKYQGKILDQCPLPSTGYCEEGDEKEGRTYTWGRSVTPKNCRGTWHGPTGATVPSSSASPPGLPSSGASNDQGAADKIKEYTPIRPGDTIKREMIIADQMALVLVASEQTMAEIMDHYEKILADKGWKTGSRFVQDDKGILMMINDQTRLTVATADEKDLKGDARTLYSLQVMIPAQ